MGNAFIAGKMVLVVMAISVISVAVYQNQSAKIHIDSTPQVSPEVASQTSAPVESPIVPTNSPIIQNTDPPPNPSPQVNTPEPTESSTFSLNELIYPGSSVQNNSNTSISLISSDNFESVKNWYKSKLDAMDFNARSFVSTNTNGDNLVKAAYAKQGLSINLEIVNANGDPITTISISLDS